MSPVTIVLLLVKKTPIIIIIIIYTQYSFIALSTDIFYITLLSMANAQARVDVLEKFSFFMDRYNDRTYRRCVDRQCPATLTTTNKFVMSFGRQHNHDGIYIAHAVESSIRGVRKRCMSRRGNHLWRRIRRTSQSRMWRFSDGYDLADIDVVHKEQNYTLIRVFNYKLG